MGMLVLLLSVTSRTAATRRSLDGTAYVCLRRESMLAYPSTAINLAVRLTRCCEMRFAVGAVSYVRSAKCALQIRVPLESVCPVSRRGRLAIVMINFKCEGLVTDCPFPCS